MFAFPPLLEPAESVSDGDMPDDGDSDLGTPFAEAVETGSEAVDGSEAAGSAEKTPAPARRPRVSKGVKKEPESPPPSFKRRGVGFDKDFSELTSAWEERFATLESQIKEQFVNAHHRVEAIATRVEQTASDQAVQNSSADAKLDALTEMMKRAFGEHNVGSAPLSPPAAGGA